MPILPTNGPDCYLVSYDWGLLSLGEYYEVDDTINDKTQKMSDYLVGLLEQAPSGAPYTDVILLNHGFFKDVAAAELDFTTWINGLMKIAPPPPVQGFKPLIVATHWPSNPFKALSDSSGTTPDDQAVITSTIANPAASPALTQAMTKLLPFSRAASSDTALGQDMADAINAAITEAQAAGDQAAAKLTPVTADTSWQGFFETIWTILSTLAGDVASGISSFWNVIVTLGSPLFSYYAHAAQTFGRTAVYALVQKLNNAKTAQHPRFHVMGHSLGTGVTSAMLSANTANHLGPSFGLVFLAEAAISNWCFAQQVPFAGNLPGMFSRVTCDTATMTGPLIATTSQNDIMVGFLYHSVAVHEGWSGTSEACSTGTSRDYAGIASVGISGPVPAPGGGTLDPQFVDYSPTQVYEPGKVYNLNGTAFISNHSDIYEPQTAKTFWAGLTAAIKG
jgi:hypothetical protein